MDRLHITQLLGLVFALVITLFHPCWTLGAEAATPITDPLDIQVLKNISEKYNYTSWTFDVDPCSPNVSNFWSGYMKCDCSFSNSSICHVVQLYMFSKNLYGPFPEDSIKLQHLNNLDFGNNFLYGPLPPTLGSLTGLTHLGVGTNSFSGPIPPELSNLTNLAALYLDSNEFTGGVPKEFAKLTNLQTLWLLDNNLSGTIPDIFGNMTSLNDLRTYGNKFQGPIPTSIANLTAMNTLYIGDLSNGGAFPSGLQNLKNISELSLRNNGMTGSIPASIGSLSKLQILDLSFNNLTGEIPQDLGNLKLLTTLFLGNNNLSGELPVNLGEISGLQAMDVSFNQLQGSLPVWLETSNNLQVNLIWNLFNGSLQNNSKSLSLSPLLDCANQNKSCNGPTKGNSFFAINVGGLGYNGSSVNYDGDSAELGQASTFMNSKQTWLVSSSGQTTKIQSGTEINGIADPVLYTTARQSLSSLRYFGLGMDNGNYSVELQFAEINFKDGSLARRIFDVYIQGVLVLKDFNIQKVANGSFKSLTERFPAEVSENILDIHFFWSGRGTCCIPTSQSYGPLISAIHVYSGIHTPQQSNSEHSGISAGQIAGIIVALIIALACGIFIIVCKKRRKNQNNEISETEAEGFISFQGAPTVFAYNDLKIATNNFHLENKLGEGGFGAVYKGLLQDGSVVAVIELSASSKQGKREFLNEVTLITGVQHRNLVRLRGCCAEADHRLLVYEFLENKSLDKILFDSHEAVVLDWVTRFNIIIGTARGLVYLHDESQARIVHRDIKASNILLDNKLQPKIADFGLARLFVEDASHVSYTGVAGTIGYLAPEYAMRGKLTEKVDVYSFGVVILEIVSGRKNTDSKLSLEMEFLLDWTWHLYENGRLLDLVDPRLAGNYNEEEVMRVILVALLCAQAMAKTRPSMTRVVSMLSGDVEIGAMPLKPSFIAELEPRKTTSLNIEGAATTTASSSSSSYPSSMSGTGHSFSAPSSAKDNSMSIVSPR